MMTHRILCFCRTIDQNREEEEVSPLSVASPGYITGPLFSDSARNKGGEKDQITWSVAWQGYAERRGEKWFPFPLSVSPPSPCGEFTGIFQSHFPLISQLISKESFLALSGLFPSASRKWDNGSFFFTAAVLFLLWTTHIHLVALQEARQLNIIVVESQSVVLGYLD